MIYHLEFSKYQGCGNDFILVDEMARTTLDDVRSRMAPVLCDRHFGIGADGLIFVERADGADGAMRLFEPAGNEADMCGNGLRCVAAFLSESLSKDDLAISTADGIKRVTRVDGGFKADMGPVRTTRSDLSEYVSDSGSPDDSMLEFTLPEGIGQGVPSLLNTGEPHIVVFVDDLDSVNVVAAGERLNSDDERFPKGININFVTVNGPREISVRTYERGVYDETMACGTGATASASAAVLRGMTGTRSVTVNTRGGALTIELGEDSKATMSGPAVKVFDGQIDLEL